MVTECDFLVVGAGIAGASAGYELAARGAVVVLERESQPGYHTTGRSAAFYAPAYGNATIRALTLGAKSFFDAPPPGFCDHPLLTPRGAVFVGRADQRAALETLYRETKAALDEVRLLDAATTCDLVPALRPEYAAGGVSDPVATDIDVHGLHQGFLKGLKGRGGIVVCDAEVRGLERTGGRWVADTPAGRFAAPTLIDAAGAWCDVVAEMAGVEPVGLVPKRRTVLTFDGPAGVDCAAWPLTVDVDEQFYFKPESGRLLASPADETPMPPCDVQPDDLDIAIAIDRLQRATTLAVPRIVSKWAGLRSFVADKTPTVGYDDKVEGFFWLAGQGGYGIQTAPSMGRVACALACGEDIPPDLADHGVTAAALAPARLRGG